MNIKKCALPAGSLIEKYLPADHANTFCCEADCPEGINPDNVMESFWCDVPGWVKALFRLRNFLARFAGLQTTEGGDTERFRTCIRDGESYKIASIAAKNDRETVLFLTDKHLDAHLSIHVAGEGASKTISAATLVHFKNRLGPVYFFVISPFHGIIVRSMLRRAVGRTVCNSAR